jgi:hypothetical protein
MRWLAPVGSVALFLALAGCGQEAEGAATKEELVSSYLNALESQDAAALEELLGDTEASQAVSGLIRDFGGRRFTNVSVAYYSFDDVYERGANCGKDPPGTGGLSYAKVRADRFVQRLDLEVRGKRCYLLLGPDNPPGASEDPLATITTSTDEP